MEARVNLALAGTDAARCKILCIAALMCQFKYTHLFDGKYNMNLALVHGTFRATARFKRPVHI